MVAVVKTGGKQYSVAQGQEILIERLVGEPGEQVEIPVILRSSGNGLDFGENVAKAEIVEHLRGEKLYVYKYKAKKRYKKKTGHRQELTRVRILEV